MPELPDLEVVCEFLAARIVGEVVTSAEVRRPLVVRDLMGGGAAEHLVGRRFTGTRRRGKFLLLEMDPSTPSAGQGAGLHLVVHPMVAGRLRYGLPLGRHRVRDALVLQLSNGQELRYYDPKDMGKVYLTNDLGRVPGLADLGPEATDPELTQDLFRRRLRRHRGEIKGALVNQRFVAGIGNAYVDEILWQAGIYPFRRCTRLTEEEVAQLYGAMRQVLFRAIETLRERVGEAIDKEVRDFLAVHGRPGEPCPRCGTLISQVKRARRATHFCRTCQPGLMVSR